MSSDYGGNCAACVACGVGVEDIRKAFVAACGKAKGYIYLTDGTS